MAIFRLGCDMNHLCKIWKKEGRLIATQFSPTLLHINIKSLLGSLCIANVNYLTDKAHAVLNNLAKTLKKTHSESQEQLQQPPVLPEASEDRGSKAIETGIIL